MDVDFTGYTHPTKIPSICQKHCRAEQIYTSRQYFVNSVRSLSLSLDIYAQLILMHSSLSNRVVVIHTSLLFILCEDVINPFVRNCVSLFLIILLLQGTQVGLTVLGKVPGTCLPLLAIQQAYHPNLDQQLCFYINKLLIVSLILASIFFCSFEANQLWGVNFVNCFKVCWKITPPENLLEGLGIRF